MGTKVQLGLSFDEAMQGLWNLPKGINGFIRCQNNGIYIEIRKDHGQLYATDPTKALYEVLCLRGVFHLKYNGMFIESKWHLFEEMPIDTSITAKVKAFFNRIVSTFKSTKNARSTRQ